MMMMIIVSVVMMMVADDFKTREKRSIFTCHFRLAAQSKLYIFPCCLTELHTASKHLTDQSAMYRIILCTNVRQDGCNLEANVP